MAMEHVRRAYEAVLVGDIGAARTAVGTALEAGVPPEQILNGGLIPAMGQVGRLFEAGEYFVPEMLVAARAMKTALALLKPRLTGTGLPPSGRVAIGTVQGDLHDIGKNLVAMMLEGAGFEVIDLGIDVKPGRFVEAASDGAEVIAMSALLTTTMPFMEATIDALREAEMRDGVKVIVGGAPVTQRYAEEIGADAYAPDAASAVRILKQMLGR